MKYFVILFLFCCLIVSCGGNNDDSVSSKDVETEVNEVLSFEPFDWDTLKGGYLGDFGGSEIRINITYVSNKNVVGYNIHKGLFRNISGKVTETMDSIVLHMDEPGDHKFDGTFQIVVLKSDLSMHGTWVPFKKGLGKKVFSLEKIIIDKDDKKLSNSNFSDYFYYVSDSLGSFYFDNSGFVKYKYYPKTDNVNYADQLEEIKGSWTISGKNLLINWAENPVFPSRKSTFKVIFDTEEYNFELIGEGRTLYANYGAG